jgi:hypothetical protein
LLPFQERSKANGDFKLLCFMTPTPKEKFYPSAILAANCTAIPEGYMGMISVKDFALKFIIKNVVTSLAEGDIKITIDPYANGLETRPFNFHLKARSDSNKEALARQLKLSFSDYPLTWTLIVNDLVTVFLEALTNYKQSFTLSEVEGEAKTWLLEPFIMEHSINVLFGMGSAGKTLLSLYLSILYGQGKGLWNKEGKQGKTLLIDFENDKTEWRDKMYLMFGNNPLDLETVEKTFFYWQSEQMPLYDQVEKLKTFIRTNGINLVIVDSASMAAGESTSDEAAALRLMAALKLLDTTIVLIAHQRKNEGEDSPIGSIQYFNQARNIWHIEGIPDETDDRIIHIGCSHKKCNNGRKHKKPIGFKAFFGEGLIDFHQEDAIANFEVKFVLSDRLMALLKNGGQTTKQMAEIVGKKEAIINTTLHRLKSKQKVNNFNGIWSLNLVV